MLYPSQSRRPRGRLASSPGGRAKFTPVGRGKPCGKTNFFQLFLTTNFAKTDAGTLVSPRGRGVSAPCAVTERGGSHVYGGAGEPPTRAARLRGHPKSARFRALARLYNFCEKECFSPPVSSASARPVPGKGGTAAPRRCPDRRRQGAPRSGGCCRGACNSRSRRRR